jgi:superfamily I DNA/RNA helicase
MGRYYLVGHPGTGKTARLVQQFAALLNAGVRPDRILVLVPQESGARRFQLALGATKRRLLPHIETFSGLRNQKHNTAHRTQDRHAKPNPLKKT